MVGADSTSTTQMHYVGVDVHQRRSSVCILNSQGKPVKEFSVKGNWADLLSQMQQRLPRDDAGPGPMSICYEASCGYGYLHAKFCALGAQSVQVAHPGQLRLIYRSKKKHDRIDAKKLAQLLYLDAVPQVHVPAANVRAWRGLIVYRHRLMNRRVGVKNQLRGLLRGLGIVAPTGKKLWSKKGIQWLKEQELNESGAALQRDLAVEDLEDLTKRIYRVETELDRIADASPAVTLLKTIPGVGRRTAEAIVAYIDDVRRFSSNKKIGSYFGLVPCQDASADRNRLGHITRDGPAVVRKFLCEAAWRGIRKSPSLRAWFERVVNGDPDRRKIALVATAHYLARIMAAMLRSGEVWRESTKTKQFQKQKVISTPVSPSVLSPPEDTEPVTALSSVEVQ